MNRSTTGGQMATPARSIEEVLRAHTQELMALPGVVGTGQGEEAGRPAILVLVRRASPDITARIPSDLEGFRVVVREVGTVRALENR